MSRTGRNMMARRTRRLKWSKLYSKKTGTLITAFGVATLVGTLAGGVNDPDVLLPGLVVGSAYILVGRRRGLPFTPTSRDRARGLAEIRRRRYALCAAIPTWFALSIGVVPHVPFQAMLTVFLLLALVGIVPFYVFVLSECPRCHQHILAGRGPYPPFLWPNRCVQCGLTFKSATRADAA
jgi:hypothetical protein